MQRCEYGTISEGACHCQIFLTPSSSFADVFSVVLIVMLSIYFILNIWKVWKRNHKLRNQFCRTSRLIIDCGTSTNGLNVDEEIIL